MLAHKSSGQGVPLVLIHAFPLCSTMWEAQVKHFEKKRKVIVMDLPGFGGSAGEAKASIATMAKQIAKVLDSLKVSEPAMICGLSMGGYVALEFFRQFPKRIKSLGLFSTRAGADATDARAKRLKTADEITKGGLEAFQKLILQKLVGKSVLNGSPELMRKIQDLIISASNREGVAAALIAMAERADSTLLLASIKCPTLIIAGDEDALIPFTESETMRRQIAGSQLQLIPNAGHLVNLEQPEAFNKALDQFLTQQSRFTQSDSLKGSLPSTQRKFK